MLLETDHTGGYLGAGVSLVDYNDDDCDEFIYAVLTYRLAITAVMQHLMMELVKLDVYVVMVQFGICNSQNALLTQVV